MSTNLFPAILFAGPPHSGKSVLAYQLSQRLLALGVEHYLLRAVPDGEGNWFLKRGPAVAGELRTRAKTGYSAAFVRHMQRVIENRPLPFLVDVGGQPEGEQRALLRACTHAVLLYRAPAELEQWRALLSALRLQTIAELHSSLDAPEQIEASSPCLRGVIANLQREPQQRASGPVFAALLELLSGICAYDRAHLERVHLAAAPYPPLLVRQLGHGLELPAGGEWLPAHLPAALQQVQPGRPIALYGRGPVWLAAALAVHAWPAPFALFDMRYGWVEAPPLRPGASPLLQLAQHTCGAAEIYEFSLPLGVLEYGPLPLPPAVIAARPPSAGQPPPGSHSPGLILSGPLPTWAFAALGRGLFQNRPWLALHDANHPGRAVAIHSRVAEIQSGNEYPLTGETTFHDKKSFAGRSA